MKVMMVMEGGDCALRIEPLDEEGLALLAAFGVCGTYQTRLGQAAGSTMSTAGSLRQSDLGTMKLAEVAS
ncbi:hypothetical protein [Accumulibacter sp.]|uniref:hypothetical protein n=1 Tax=Accumulibacter sp. TaxID=2053492 RepID=UPI0025E22D56|nr:hypothetical protein [Accumulibacter sp.]MCM8612696.1 hypothetical protein [Accumulibacter sp.]MCM8636464.1 hypothetical protein [Accumulibacter sp.]MCM8640172.1 hypothetical protein [Accumulibacter sp.]